ncbi:MAG: CHAT domain-containing protein [Anaerolineae bacterium]
MPSPLPVIFLAFANDPEHPLPRLTDEAQKLRQALERPKVREVCELVVREHASLAQVADVFADPHFASSAEGGEVERIAVFHYGGHANAYQLRLEAPAGTDLPPSAGVVAGAAFARYLGNRKGLHLVFLNGCATRDQAKALLDAGVQAVIVTSQSVRDDVATEFASRFYGALAGNGFNIRRAFDEARSLAEAGDAQGNRRSLLSLDLEPDVADQIIPWELQVSERFPAAGDWDLGQAANKPFFGLPPLPLMDLPVGSPFRRLEWYAEEHAAVFFGRGWDTRRLFDRVTNPHSDPVVFVFGQTGVGKSSLLAAGLIPRLKASDSSAPAPLYVRRDHTTGLAGTLLAALGLVAADGAAREAWRKRESAGPQVIILDQVEEAYTRPMPDGQPQQELAALADLINAIFFTAGAERPKGKLILSFRKEWLAELNKMADDHGIGRTDFYVSPLGAAHIVEVVRGPADEPRLQQRYGLVVEGGVAETIAADLTADPGAPLAPMLQVLLDRLWTDAKGNNVTAPTFSLALYDPYKHSLGLDHFLKEQLVAMEAGPQAAVVRSGLALDILEGHTTPLDTAGEHTLADLQATYPHHAESVPEIVQDFKSRYVLVDRSGDAADRLGGSRLAHDTLAPMVRERFKVSGAPGQRARRLLENRRVDPTVPLDEHDLGLVEAGLTGTRKLADDEESLLTVSRDARARRRRRWQVLTTGAALLVIGIILAAGYAWVKKRESEAQRDRADTLTRTATIRGTWGQLAGQRGDRQLILAAQNVLWDSEWDDVDVWQARDGLLSSVQSQSNTLGFLPDHTDSVRSVAFSPDGQTLASGSSDKAIILWDIATRKPSGRPLTGHTEPVISVAFSPDGKILASGSDDKAIILWDVAKREAIQVLSGHTDSVRSVAFSPDGKTLASGSKDDAVILWDVATRLPIGQPLTGHATVVNSVAFSPDGKTLATGSGDSTIVVWDVATRLPIGQPLSGHTAAVFSVAFSPDGKTLASGSSDKTIILWDVAKREPIGQPLTGHTNSVNSVAFSPDGKTLASGSSDKTIILWNVAMGTPIGQPLSGHTISVNSVVFSPDGETLSSGSKDKTIILWDVTKRSPIGQPLKGHTETVFSVAFSPNSKTLASVSMDKSIILWDLAKREPIGQPLTGHTEAVVSVAFSPDGRTLASGSYDNSIILWDVAKREPIGQPLTGHTDIVNSVAFSPDGKTLASGSHDNAIILWDVAERKPIGQPLTGHTKPVASVAFSPDGKTLASGSSDRAIVLWDVAKRVPIGQPLTGHTENVVSVAFSPDGKTMASGSLDNTIILWDVAKRFPIGQPLTGHTNSVYSVAFSPDGKTMASGSGDNTIILWDVDPASWMNRACHIANRNLTMVEWTQFIGDLPYECTCPEGPAGVGAPWPATSASRCKIAPPLPH